MRKWIGIGVVSAATLIGGGIWAHAQVQVPNTRPEDAMVLSGADLGFRVDTWDGDVPVGKFVVRHNGKWVEPKVSGAVRRLTAN